MSVAKKKNIRLKSSVVVVTKTSVPLKEAIFPDKIKKVKDVLAKAKFNPS
jgi:hypothetical protein